MNMLPHDSPPIAAELYALNVYTSGGHFASHKDTPRGQDMFGSLVVCLPSLFRRGELLLTHRGVVQSFDWGRQSVRNGRQTSFIGLRFSETWIIRSKESALGRE